VDIQEFHRFHLLRFLLLHQRPRLQHLQSLQHLQGLRRLQSRGVEGGNSRRRIQRCLESCGSFPLPEREGADPILKGPTTPGLIGDRAVHPRSKSRPLSALYYVTIFNFRDVKNGSWKVGNHKSRATLLQSREMEIF
jgi:hypothetical protein